MAVNGGGGEIRTHDGVAPMPVFKTGAFNRSATPPTLLSDTRIRKAGKALFLPGYFLFLEPGNTGES